MAQHERRRGHKGPHSPILVVVNVGAAEADPTNPDKDRARLELRPQAILNAQIPRAM